MKKALVTGAGSGLGRELSILLSEQGYRLFLTSRDLTSLEETKSKLISDRDTKLLPLDLSKKRDLEQLLSIIEKTGFDLVINAAGATISTIFICVRS